MQVCPAAIDLDARQIVVKCPIDIHLTFGYDDQKRPMLRPVDGPMSTVRPKHLGAMMTIVNRGEWRHPDRPILQIITPYIFLADERGIAHQKGTGALQGRNDGAGPVVGRERIAGGK